MTRGRRTRRLARVALWLAVTCGCDGAPRCPPAALAPLAAPPRYAVVSSDYGATAIALLDAEGAPLEEAWLDSGTTATGLVATLSGDVSLPSAPFDDCTLVVIDRLGTDVVSFLDVCGGPPVRAQVDVGAGFGANPQDVLRIDDRLAWVSRPGVDHGADPPRGGDLAVVDVTRGEVIDRVSLAPLEVEAGTFARPRRLAWVRAGALARVVVGAERLSATFQEAAEGAVGLVDPETHAVLAHPLPGLRNCGELDPVPDEPARVLVSCAGATFGQAADRRDGAGIAWLELTPEGALREVARYAAADHPGGPVVESGAVPLTGGRALVIASGDLGQTVDRALVVDRAGGEPRLLFEADDAYVLHEGAYDAARDLLLVADAARGEVRRFVGLEERASIPTAGCRGLPPREIARLTIDR